LTLIPFLKAARELKTKPTQHSVGQLRQIGIQPDILICRTEVPLSHEERAKIGLFCNIVTDAVIEEKDKEFSIYEVPIRLHEHKLDQLIVDKLRIHNAGSLELDDWHELWDRICNPVHEVTVAVVGEYMATPDAYKSTFEALDHAGIAHRTKIRTLRISSHEVLQNKTRQELCEADAIIVSGSFGESEIEGKIEAVRIAREYEIPFLGIGLGMQCAIIEFARNMMNLEGAHSTEYDKNTLHPVICLRTDHRSLATHEKIPKTGADTTVFLLPSRIADAYGNRPLASERFRYCYEFNNHYRDQWKRSTMRFSAQSADGLLVQAVELPEHPWFVAVQFHPEFKSQPTKPHPLFATLIAETIKRKNK
jgi:CTP synthase